MIIITMGIGWRWCRSGHHCKRQIWHRFNLQPKSKSRLCILLLFPLWISHLVQCLGSDPFVRRRCTSLNHNHIPWIPKQYHLCIRCIRGFHSIHFLRQNHTFSKQQIQVCNPLVTCLLSFKIEIARQLTSFGAELVNWLITQLLIWLSQRQVTQLIWLSQRQVTQQLIWPSP